MNRKIIIRTIIRAMVAATILFLLVFAGDVIDGWIRL